MGRFFLLLLIAVCIAGGLYILNPPEKPVHEPGRSPYELWRADFLRAVAGEWPDEYRLREAFEQLPTLRVSDWPREFWWRVTMTDPRGGITVFQDAMMAGAVGTSRLWSPDDVPLPVREAITKVLFWRQWMWQDWPWENHYAREKAMQAALAFATGQTDRFNREKARLHEALDRIFNRDGSSKEGTSYGIYTVSVLTPYAWMTGDKIVQGYVDRFYQWLTNVSDTGGHLPPFDDSVLLRMPVALSLLPDTTGNPAERWQPGDSAQDYFGPNETVLKKDRATLWVRHKRSLDGRIHHQHFSQGDILWKSRDNWWLIPAGYLKDKNLRSAHIHNLTVVKPMRDDILWRLKSIAGDALSTQRLNADASGIDLRLPDGIRRHIMAGINSLTVEDRHPTQNFHVYWHILGEKVQETEEDDRRVFVFRQGQEELRASFSGFVRIQEETAPHRLTGLENQKHTVIHLSGNPVTSHFIFMSGERMHE